MATPVVVVTGAASGIGRACVELFAERGFKVVAVDLAEDGLAELAAIAGVVTLTGDIAAETTNTAMVRLAADRFGRLDVAVLNAGIGGTPPLEAAGAIERFDRILAVNVRGVALGIRAAAPALRAAGGGAIVVTASVAGLRGEPGNWAYNASKAAAINLVRATAIDYAAHGIRINTLAPGGTVTAMTAGALANPELAADVTRRIPMQRWASPREQAEVVWFLASPAASYITGATLPCDGGLNANTGILLPPPSPANHPDEVLHARGGR